MLYLAYERLKRNYHGTQRELDAAISEKQSKIGTRAAGKQRLEARIEELKGILAERADLLKAKEAELKASKDVYDRIYRMRYIDREKVRAIARRVGYSEPQTYRLLKEIQTNVNRVNDDTGGGEG